MPTASYQNILQMATSLSAEEQFRLIQELTVRAGKSTPSSKKSSILELRGLGQEIWRQIDALEYVDRERSSWNG